MSKVVAMKGNKEVYEVVMNNTVRVGNKEYGSFPIGNMKLDPDFQRIEYDNKKVNKLINNWDNNQMDALKVVAHPEEYLVYVVDGGHRLAAAKALGITHLPCELISGAPTDPKERKIFEAKIFLGQLPCVEKLTPVQMHKARILTGDETAIILERLLKEYDLKIVNSKGIREPGVVGSYTRAYKIVSQCGEKGLRFVFEICKNSGYNFERNGYSNSILGSLNKMYKAYGEPAKIVSERMRPLRPSLLKAKALATYPERDAVVALALYFQDYYVTKTGVTPVISKTGKIAV